jgi:hypothetical protein
MGRRKKKMGTGDVLFGLAFVVFAIFAAIPKIVWISLGGIAVALLPFYLYGKYKKSRPPAILTDKNSPFRTASRTVAPYESMPL